MQVNYFHPISFGMTVPPFTGPKVVFFNDNSKLGKVDNFKSASKTLIYWTNRMKIRHQFAIYQISTKWRHARDQNTRHDGHQVPNDATGYDYYLITCLCHARSELLGHLGQLGQLSQLGQLNDTTVSQENNYCPTIILLHIPDRGLKLLDIYWSVIS